MARCGDDKFRNYAGTGQAVGKANSSSIEAIDVWMCANSALSAIVVLGMLFPIALGHALSVGCVVLQPIPG